MSHPEGSITFHESTTAASLIPSIRDYLQEARQLGVQVRVGIAENDHGRAGGPLLDPQAREGRSGYE